MTYRWIFSLIIALSLPLLSIAQSGSIPLNHNELPVISTPKVYKLSVKDQPLKRMVAVKKYVVPLHTDFKYASRKNFTSQVLYKNPVPYLRLEAAEALAKVQDELVNKGFTLVIFDAYRPYSVTEKMWEIVPDERYAANPANGSGHNRGASVDVTIAELPTGKELTMPTTYDDFTEKAHHDYTNLDAIVLENRKLLKTVMEKHGFVALRTEWWHYSLPNASAKYDLLNLSFKQMKKLVAKKY